MDYKMQQILISLAGEYAADFTSVYLLSFPKTFTMSMDYFYG